MSVRDEMHRPPAKLPIGPLQEVELGGAVVRVFDRNLHDRWWTAVRGNPAHARNAAIAISGPEELPMSPSKWETCPPWCEGRYGGVCSC